MLLLLTTEKEQKKEYKEMLEGLCEEMPDKVWKVRKSKLGFKIVQSCNFCRHTFLTIQTTDGFWVPHSPKFRCDIFKKGAFVHLKPRIRATFQALSVHKERIETLRYLTGFY